MNAPAAPNPIPVTGTNVKSPTRKAAPIAAPPKNAGRKRVASLGSRGFPRFARTAPISIAHEAAIHPAAARHDDSVTGNAPAIAPSGNPPKTIVHPRQSRALRPRAMSSPE
jgi:hypothetical protein